MTNDTEVPTCEVDGCTHLATRGAACLTHYAPPKPPAEMADRIAEYARQIAASAPPLTSSQRDTIALALRAAK